MKQVNWPPPRFASQAATRYLGGALFFAAALVGCSGSPGTPSTFAPSLATPVAGLPQSLGSQRALDRYAHRIGKNVQKETVLYSFAFGGDGAFPEAGLTNLGGTLYGATFEGGASGDGTVFKVTTSGAEKILHSFASSGDGTYPSAGLTDVGGALYGTTWFGGEGSHCYSHYSRCGTIFKITISGRETVLYSFADVPDGANPIAGLTNVHGTLYGTTDYGGDKGLGTVFKITTSGMETVIHSFGRGSDGARPYAGLTNVDGTLYGTTSAGGDSRCDSGRGCGTVFMIVASGKESVLHAFGRGGDGAFPYAGLTNVGGALYGTTEGGGAGNACYSEHYLPCGTVFKITTSGTERVLHSFGTGSDGANPYSGLTNVRGTLYGTTSEGGAKGLGTVFKVKTSGKETVLYSFLNLPDGSQPYAGLTNIGRTLYGTTKYGGASGYGSVFSLSL